MAEGLDLKIKASLFYLSERQFLPNGNWQSIFRIRFLVAHWKTADKRIFIPLVGKNNDIRCVNLSLCIFLDFNFGYYIKVTENVALVFGLLMSSIIWTLLFINKFFQNEYEYFDNLSLINSLIICLLSISSSLIYSISIRKFEMLTSFFFFSNVIYIVYKL